MWRPTYGEGLERALVQICLGSMFQTMGGRSRRWCMHRRLIALIRSVLSYSHRDHMNWIASSKSDLASHHVVGAFDMTRTHGEAALRQTT